MGYAISKVAWSNIRKRKSAAITFMILILLSVMLLYIGLSVMLRLGSFQEHKKEELNVPDIIAFYKESREVSSFQEVVKNDPATLHWEAERALQVGESKIRYADSEVLASLLILNKDAPRSLSPYTEVDPHAEPAGKALIYLPYMFQLSGGYKAGNTFTIPIKGSSYSFMIGGFFEEALLGSFTNGPVKLFANESAYRQLEKVLGQEARYELLSGILDNPSQSVNKLCQDLSEKLTASDASGNYTILDGGAAMEGNQFMVRMLAAILVVFSLLIVSIALVVMRFQILVQIEDSMVNIGVLKANGYTSRQIRSSILLQFLFIGLTAALPSLGLSAVVMPFVGNMISASLGLLWSPSFDSISAVVSLMTIVGLLLLVAFLSSRRIGGITPIAALQSGLQTHNFKRNPLPLANSRLPLQLALGLKALIRQTKQNAMLVLIVTGLTFSSVFCLILNFNMTRDNTEVIKLVGIERSNVKLAPKQGKITPERYNELSSMEGVRKLALLDGMNATIENQMVLLQVSNDFSKLETQTVYKGRHPLYDNEISLSGMVAKRIGKSIGDEVPVMANGITHTYIITGLSQQITQLGMVASMTEEGFVKLMPDYTAKTLDLYLKEGTDPQAFVQELEERFPGVWITMNMEEWLEGTLRTFTYAISTITWTVTAVTLFVVSLILYLVIKTLVIRRKRELGILKGLGHTSHQLMTQITLSLLPVILMGVAVGSLLGYLYSDRLFMLLLSSLGIYNVEFSVNLPEVSLLCLGLLAVSCVVSMLVSRRVRKISVTSLITD
ncbi:ABC transporter permease [Gorillibacterium timonense]|uniref:ABC transporter permease n=1 Tax=Gorillibacterium timonense TaxID=1689269 RepID=UPI00071C6985|nr:ABC transporter permease [Gorillibacterium timonense]